jgi:hypothetical protein
MNPSSIRSLRRAVTVAAVAVVGLIGGATPVLAAPIGDGTSNTVAMYTLNNTMVSGYTSNGVALNFTQITIH